MIVRVGFRQHRLDFKHANHWKEADEEQEQGEEEAERSNEHRNVHPRRMEHTPSRGCKIANERRGNNHKALVPHARVRKLNDDPNPNKMRAEILEPKKLWRNDIAKHHAEICPPVRS